MNDCSYNVFYKLVRKKKVFILPMILIISLNCRKLQPLVAETKDLNLLIKTKGLLLTTMTYLLILEYKNWYLENSLVLDKL